MPGLDSFNGPETQLPMSQQFNLMLDKNGNGLDVKLNYLNTKSNKIHERTAAPANMFPYNPILTSSSCGLMMPPLVQSAETPTRKLLPLKRST